MRLSARRLAMLLICMLALSAPSLPTALGAQPTMPSPKPVVGSWQGALLTAGGTLRLGLTVRSDSTGRLSGYLTSIDQGDARIPATFSVRGDTLVVAMPAINAVFSGALVASRDTLRGQFVQGGAPLPLVMTRVASGGRFGGASARPQTPVPPFPYRSVEVAIPSVANVVLAGTLTTPSGVGPFSTVVLVTGSGPQDRDATMVGHKPFLLLADHLARRGIATLRYDDRGVGKSTGRFASATTADLADDAEAVVRFLRARPEVAKDRIGMLGHSEGGIIGPLVAARSTDVAFLVLLAAPALRGDSLLMLQNAAIFAALGLPPAAREPALAIRRQFFTVAVTVRDSARAERELSVAAKAFVDTLPDAIRVENTEGLTQLAREVMQPWMRYFLAFDPAPVLRRVRVPVLALNGTLDLQVTPRENLGALRRALTAASNRDHTEEEMTGLNHLFQKAATGLPNEYAQLEETMAPAVLARIATWITARIAKP